MHILLRRPAIIALGAVFALGCAQKTEVVAAQPTIPDTPDGTIRAVAQNLADKHPDILWEALPESYRNDINELTTTFAAKMDPELYDRAMALALSLVEVVQAKQDIILASDTVARTGVEISEIDTKMTSGLIVAQSFFSSEVSSLAGLAAIDWQQFLGGTGSQFMVQAAAMDAEEEENPLLMFETLEVEILEETEDTARLRVTADGHDPEEFTMVRVEDRWVPKEMADQWPTRVAEARTRLEEITPEQMEEIKGQAMFGIAMGEGFIAQMSTIETSEEFDATVGPMFEGLMENLGNFMPEATEATKSDETAATN